ncbi:MAG: Nif3-like dinuclear metal center hexameric protein [Flavisolibacter sp.]
MKIAELISVLEAFAAPQLQEDYDNAGLLTGSPGWECSGVLCTLDITPGVVSEAKSRGCNLIVAHHPIIFRGLKRINGKNAVEKVVIEAIKNDIALYAAHTNLDNVAEGVNARIAREIGLRHTSVLQPKPRLLRKLFTFVPSEKAETLRQALFAAGAGHIGRYAECSFNAEGTGTYRAGEGANPYAGRIGERHNEKETRIEVVYPFHREAEVVRSLLEHHPYEEVAYDLLTLENPHPQVGSGLIGQLDQPVEEKIFLKMLKEKFQARGIRHTALLGKPVQKVAVCGGAGSFLIPKALQQGADFYLTADIKYHEFFEAEDRLVLADLGHYESEQYTIDLLHDLLVEKFPTFAVLKTKVNTNPVRYFEE